MRFSSILQIKPLPYLEKLWILAADCEKFLASTGVWGGTRFFHLLLFLIAVA